MLISVLIISGALLSATVLASILTLNQLSSVRGAEESAQAIFAADAGVERALYQKFQVAPAGVGYEMSCTDEPQTSDDFNISLEKFNSNSSKVSYDIRFLPTGNDDCALATQVISGGRSHNTSRAFQIYLEGIESFGGQFRD